MTAPEPFNLRDRTAIVMGGSGTLGRAIAEGLADCGARVVIGGRDISRAEAVAIAIRDHGGQAMAVTADALRCEQLEDALENVTTAWGAIDILVNATGGNLPAATLDQSGDIRDLDLHTIGEVVDKNLTTALLPIQVIWPAMTRDGRGSVINISSMAASRPLTRVGGYGAAKAALENFTRWLAITLAEEGSGVRVNAIAPGFFVTDQNRDLMMEGDHLTQRGQAIIAHTPMGRLGDPRDLTGAACWLASDASRFVTGAVIPIDGGFSASAGV
jgi:NAD(P)-dependent dehydrogenase (short-subunit alcohol dehydrogenase family)